MSNGHYFASDELPLDGLQDLSTDRMRGPNSARSDPRILSLWTQRVSDQLRANGTSDVALEHILAMYLNSPSRPVGKAALTNVTVRFQSSKSPSPCMLESHSCELVLAYELEWNDDVISFVNQVECIGVERLVANGRRHVSSAVADALVISRTRAVVIEAKTGQELTKLCLEKPGEWSRTKDGWERPPLIAWAAAWGLEYQVWSSPWPNGIYLQNLEQICRLRQEVCTTREEWLIQRLVSAVRSAPQSIADLQLKIPQFTPRIAVLAVARKLAFGLIKSACFAETETFMLFAERDQAAALDDMRLRTMATSLGPLDVESALTNATPRAFARAKAHLHTVMQGLEKGAQVPQRLNGLKKIVCAALERGEDPLPLCLPNFSACGNRTPRLLEQQTTILANQIKTGWLSGKHIDLLELHYRISKDCEAMGLPPVGETTVRRAIAAESIAKRALATGGKRKFQKTRSASDPSDRTLAPAGVGFRLHIDSSKFDNRSAPDLAQKLVFEAPTIYVGVDSCHRGPSSHALIFGHARTDGLAIILRGYVKRHGRLPKQIFVDRGPDNTSDWLKTFCDDFGIDLLWSPTAGSRFNSLAENMIGRINTQLAHRLPGSTLADQKGRNVDGAFKSQRTASLQFGMIAKECEKLLYGDFMDQPAQQGGTPRERMKESIDMFGHIGMPCAYDDWLFIQTAVAIPLAKVDKIKGVRLEEGTYASIALFKRASNSIPLEMRLDCVNPTRLYVRFPTGWVVARSASAQLFSSFEESEQTFRLMYAPYLRAEHDLKSAEIRGKRTDRLAQAVMQLPATAHLSETSDPDPGPRHKADAALPDFDFDALPTYSREEQG